MTNREIESCFDIMTKTIDLHNKTIERLGEEIEKLQVQLGDAEANAKLALWKIKEGK